jgi:hypothetical protein
MSEQAKKEYREAFDTELKALLNKYKVSLVTTDIGKDYFPEIIIETDFEYHEKLHIIDDISYGSNISCD